MTPRVGLKPAWGFAFCIASRMLRALSTKSSSHFSRKLARFYLDLRSMLIHNSRLFNSHCYSKKGTLHAIYTPLFPSAVTDAMLKREQKQANTPSGGFCPNTN